jgi:hypothetical protein
MDALVTLAAALALALVPTILVCAGGRPGDHGCLRATMTTSP